MMTMSLSLAALPVAAIKPTMVHPRLPTRENMDIEMMGMTSKRSLSVLITKAPNPKGQVPQESVYVKGIIKNFLSMYTFIFSLIK